MPILIVVDAQCLKIVFSFEKGLSGQNHSLSDSRYLISPPPPTKFSIPL